MTQLLLSRVRLPSPSAPHFFSPPPFFSRLKVSLSQSLPHALTSFLCACVIRLFSFMQQPFLIFLSHLFLSAMFLHFLFLHHDSSLILSCNPLFAVFIILPFSSFFIPLFLQSMFIFPLSISPSFCLSFYSIPSLNLQLWQRTISPPILSCVPRLPWTRAAVWRE